MFDKKNRITIMDPKVKEEYMKLTGMDENFYSEKYKEAFYEFHTRAMEVVSNHQRRRLEGIPKKDYGRVMDVMARAPNYLKDARFRCLQQANRQTVWIHDVMLVVYDVKAMSPEDMDILVPEEAELGMVYDPKHLRRDGAFQTEKMVMCEGKLRRKFMHHKCTAFAAMLNWFPTVCMGAEYIRSRNPPSPFLFGPMVWSFSPDSQQDMWTTSSIHSRSVTT